MLNLRLSEVALWTGGQLSGADIELRDVATDSRKLAGGELFVALRGEHHDGHDHVVAAAAAGAAAALVARRVDVDLPQVLVTNTLIALGDLASAVRAKRSARVIGITGSNGKTTVKTLLTSILSRHGRTHATAGNFNNEIGLPLTLLAMPEDAEYAVLEMGAGKPGDIAYLAAIARPEIGLVNTIAPGHLERMGSMGGVAETKGALYQALPADGTAVINADDRFAGFFAGLAGSRRILRFGLDHAVDVGADVQDIQAHASRFVLSTSQGKALIELPLPGLHNIRNALAAATLACALDVPLQCIVDGLNNAVAVSGRLQAQVMPGGWTVIDDSYNANPGSVKAAIDTLALVHGERWLVLGDMAELGPEAPRLHADVGVLARERGIDRLFTVGVLAQAASGGFGGGACHCQDQAALIKTLRAELHEGVTCLVKGSRSAAMDRVVAALTGEGTHDAA